MRRMVLLDYGDVRPSVVQATASAGVELRTFHYSSDDALAARLGSCATATGAQAREHQS
jgi:hypothetical protein